ncbi:MAG: hypothetical protein ABSG53_13965 [Thermoguttaceae bacterium]
MVMPKTINHTDSARQGSTEDHTATATVATANPKAPARRSSSACTPRCRYRMYIPHSVNMAKTTSRTEVPRQSRSTSGRCSMNAAYSALSNSSFGSSIDSPALTSRSPGRYVNITRSTLSTFSFWASLLAWSTYVSVVTGCEGCKRRGSSQV